MSYATAAIGSKNPENISSINAIEEDGNTKNETPCHWLNES